MADRSVVVRLRAEVADFKRQMDDAAKATRKVGDETETSAKKADTGLGRMVQSANQNREAWNTAGAALTAFGAATVTGLGFATGAAMSWESAWTGVLKTVDGTPAQLAAVEAGLRSMARELPAAHEEIAAVAEAAGQLGVSTDGIVSFTRTMIDLGETTNLQAQEAAMALAKFAAVVGTSEADIPRLGSAIVGLGNNFATTEADIVQMATRLSAAGAIAGFTEPQILGLSAAMSSIGIEAEAGGTAMSQTIQTISKAVIDGGEDLAGFARIAGVSATDFAETWRSDPIVALDSVIGGMARMNESGQNTYQTLEDLGISGIRQVGMLQGLATATGLATDAVALASDEWERNNALILEATKRYETTESKIQIAKNGINDAAITIGQTFLPMLASAAEGVADLAETIGDLPPGVLTAGAALAGIAGTASLAAGAFLLIVPRVLDTVTAFKTLSASGSRIPGVMAGVGKAAGIAGAAVGIIYLTDALTNLADGAGRSIPGVQDLTASILDLDAASTTAMFSTSRNVDDVTEALDALTGSGGITRKLDLFASKLDGVFGTSMVSSVADSRAAFEQYDKALSGLVSAGHADRAAEGLELLYAQVDQTKYSMDDLRGLLPGYAEALAAADNQQKLAADSAGGLADAAAEVDPAVEAMTEAIAKWVAEVAAADGAFIDLLGGYDAIIAKNRETAEATAAATESSSDSWQDYYDGFSVSVSEYLAELERQVAAQQAWETNMLLLSGRVSQGVIDELARLGPEGAPLVADLVNASDAELARLEDVYGQRSTNATNQFANNLRLAAPVLAAIMGKAGTDAANEAAAKLAAGEMTLQQVIDAYDLDFVVDADTVVAQTRIDTFVARNNGRTVSINVHTKGNLTPYVQTVPEANGGVVDYYGAGGIRESHVAQIAPAGAWRVWAEPETGGESYIPLAPAKRARSRQIWAETGKRLGVQGYADGAVTGRWAPSASTPAAGAAQVHLSVGQINTRDTAEAITDRILTKTRDALAVQGIHALGGVL